MEQARVKTELPYCPHCNFCVHCGMLPPHHQNCVTQVSGQQAPDRLFRHSITGQVFEERIRGPHTEYARVADTRVPGDQMSAEGWLAYVGYADSRPHSATAIAELLTAYADYRNAATTPPVPDRLRDGDTYVDYERDPSTGEVFTVQMVAVAAPSDLISREAMLVELRDRWLAAYPVEVFPEPPDPPANCSRDSIAAAMGRHMATRLIEFVTALPAAQPPTPPAATVECFDCGHAKHTMHCDKMIDKYPELNPDYPEQQLCGCNSDLEPITRALSGKEEI